MSRATTGIQFRELIARATLTRIQAGGVAGWDLDDIARDADVGYSLLRQHFASREELLQEALALLLREFGRRVAEAVAEVEGTARDRLLALSDAAASDQMLRFSAALLEFRPLARREAVQREALAGLYDGLTGFISTIIREGQARGEPGPNLPAEDVTALLLALTDGLMLHSMLGGRGMSPARARDLRRAAIDALLPPADLPAEERP